MALHCIALPPIDPFLNFNSYCDLRWPSNAVARVYDLHEDLNKLSGHLHKSANTSIVTYCLIAMIFLIFCLLS